MIEKIRATVCAWLGHSRVSTGFMGYQYCGRCGAQVGDTLAGVGVSNLYFPVHGNQECCRKNKTALTWKDQFLLPKKVRDQKEITPEMVKEAKEIIRNLAAKRASR